MRLTTEDTELTEELALVRPKKFIAAKDIEHLLARRHAGDIFVRECKDGPTASVRNYLRMDAWAMARSWSQPLVTAYEIKVNRSDFLNDVKWRSYLPLCNCLYFVAPKGLISIAELPKDVGLIECTTNALRLITRKKAPHRAVKLPESLFRYVLMSRSRIVNRDLVDGAKPTVSYWRGVLAEKAETRELGHLVAKSLQETVAHHKRVTGEALEKAREFRDIEQFLESIGLNPKETYIWRGTVERRIEELNSIVPRDVVRALKTLVDKLPEVLAGLDPEKKEAP